MSYLPLIQQEIRDTQTTIERLLNDTETLALVDQVAMLCVDALKAGNKILFMGNGGSAADSQHLAAELVSRFHFDRPGLPGIALTTDTSAITAIGNDYGYENLFSRQIEALGQKGDVVFAITTSGKSPNILRGVDAAKARGLHVIGLTGAHPNTPLTAACDHTIHVPSTSTPKIQEGHIVIGHILCCIIEEALFSALKPVKRAM